MPESQLDALPYCDQPDFTEAGLEPIERWRFMAPSDGTQFFGIPLVANLDDDNADGVIDLCDSPDVVVQSSLYDEGAGKFLIRLFVLSGVDGGLQRIIEADGRLSIAVPAVFDLDSDGEPEILATNDGGHVVALSPSGQVLWESPVEVFDAFGWYGVDPPFENQLRARYVTFSAITAADLDGDGSPEVSVGMTVLDADGSLRFEDPTRASEYGDILQYAPVRPVVSDLDGDGVKEVLFGHVGYRADGTEFFRLPLTTTPGLSHVADFLGEGDRQVLIQSSEGLTLVSSSGQILWGPLGPHDGGLMAGGVPTPHPAAIVDVLGDASPEVLIDTETASMVYRITQAGPVMLRSESATQAGWPMWLGSTAFDFRGAGADWIAATHTGAQVFDRAGPETVGEVGYSTSWGGFFPVVADIDNNGAADILIRGGSSSLSQWVAAYEDALQRPSPARRIWNQWNYTASGVREDARLPGVTAAQEGKTFRVQARLGCQPVPVAE